MPSFTFTNTTLTVDDLSDKYCNELLEIISNYNAEIIVASDILYNYIKEKYPDIKLTASVIKSSCLDFKNLDEETFYINKLSESYDKVVIRSEYFLKKDNFNDVKNIKKLIILVNSTCEMDCPSTKRHYDLIGKFHRGEITYNEGFEEFLTFCPKIINPFSQKNTLGDKNIEKALKLGINNLKLQGRQCDFNEMFSILCGSFFKKNINKKELKKQIDNICAKKLQNSTDLQMYSILKNI